MVKRLIPRSLAMAGAVTAVALVTAACEPDPEYGEIYFGRGQSINADGSGEATIPDYPDNANYLSFSPDGANTLYLDYTDDGTRLVVDSLGFTAPTTVFTEDENMLLGASEWSPDGEWIAFQAYRDGEGYFVGLIRPDGSDLTWLATDGTPDADGVSWLPDSSAIVYLSQWVTASADFSLCTTTVATDSVDCVPLPGELMNQYAGARVSPDGETVLFHGRHGTPGDDPIFDVMQVDIDGTNLVNLTGNEAPQSTRSFAWAPDGSAIAFDRSQMFGGSDGTIWTMASDGSDQVQLTDDSASGSFRNLAWRPTPAE